MSDTITARNISKRFLLPSLPRGAKLKDVVVRTIKRDENASNCVDALSDVSFAVERGSTFGVIGRNGSGKSTLMKIIGGILQPTSGAVTVEGRIAPLLAIGTGFHPDMTGREGARIELFALGMSRREVAELIPRIITFSEIGEFVDAPVRTYSTGMLMRMAFAVAVCVDPEVLLIDEILAVGDAGFAVKCEQCIENFRARGKTIVLVTHDTTKVKQMCDLALWLDEGMVAAMGDPKSVVDTYNALTVERATAQR